MNCLICGTWHVEPYCQSGVIGLTVGDCVQPLTVGCTRTATSQIPPDVPRHGGGKTERELRTLAQKVVRQAKEDVQVFGCGPGAALPADTVTEGARLPRKTREELVREFDDLFDTSREEWMKGIFGKTDHLEPQHKRLQRLADLAGQIAGQIAGMSE